MSAPVLDRVNGSELTTEQKSYLEGLFAGLRERGYTFNGAPASRVAAEPSSQDLIFEERVKKELHPLDAYSLLLDHASGKQAPERENIFRFKWQGLFYMTPKKESFMARLRIPAGQLQSFQLRELAKIADDLTTGYLQITTRSNLQMRFIDVQDTPEFLRRIQAIGLHTRGAGADNIRNITANPTFGIDPAELIDVSPLAHQLGQLIIQNREFYDLPRKFNIALDGGGAIGCVEDTNDIGLRAMRLVAGGAIEPGVYYRVKLGGATGHKAFAEDAEVIVAPHDAPAALSAMVRVYIINGNRGDRKKARLKHLLENWGLQRFIQETNKLLKKPLITVIPDMRLVDPPADKPHSHVGFFPQKQQGLYYAGVAIPVGHLTSKQLIKLAELADLYGSGEVRLTVWQNLVIPNIPEHCIEPVKKALTRMGLDWKQSNLRSGLVACTGNSYCKFASANTKGNAVDLANYLEKRVELDVPVNIHLTGCPNSCAQHYIGDIGLLATTTKIAGETLEAYHVFVGGGFGPKKAVGRQVFTAISVEQLKPTIERMLKAYLNQRTPGETFQAFTARFDLRSLQNLFCEVP